MAYAIGVARPVSLLVETFGTETVDPARIEKAIDEVFDLRPAAIIRDLDLRRPIYRKTAAYGHFGRSEKEFSWEQLTRLDDFTAALGGESRGAKRDGRGRTARAGAGAPARQLYPNPRRWSPGSSPMWPESTRSSTTWCQRASPRPYGSGPRSGSS